MAIDKVKLLAVTDPCPCKSGKVYSECCIQPLKAGWTPELTMYLLSFGRDAEQKPVYAVQALKLNGEATAEQVFKNIESRLSSPIVQRTFEKLVFKEAITPPRDPTPFVVLSGESKCPEVDVTIEQPCACCSNSGMHVIDDDDMAEYCLCFWGEKMRVQDKAPPKEALAPELKDRIILSGS